MSNCKSLVSRPLLLHMLNCKSVVVQDLLLLAHAFRLIARARPDPPFSPTPPYTLVPSSGFPLPASLSSEMSLPSAAPISERAAPISVRIPPGHFQGTSSVLLRQFGLGGKPPAIGNIHLIMVQARTVAMKLIKSLTLLLVAALLVLASTSGVEAHKKGNKKEGELPPGVERPPMAERPPKVERPPGWMKPSKDGSKEAHLTKPPGWTKPPMADRPLAWAARRGLP
eukprot:gene5967-5250_t